MMTGVVTPPSIGRLRIERQLGAGGFATVWLAHDPELDAPVAVKILAENFAAHADIRRRFTDEARLLRRVDSDHLVRVYDVGELPDGRPYFVMTFADGGSLAERLVRVPPPWPSHSVLAVVEAVAEGLAVLHRHGIVHRDLKPVNVLLRSLPEGGERVLLGDLGIAKDLQWASGVTMPAGSSGYAAPEQEAYSERIGPPTDVHALAVTAALLLGLPRPWPPTPLGAALARATDPDPDRRTPSAPAFAAELRDALGAAPTAVVTPPLAPPGAIPGPGPGPGGMARPASGGGVPGRGAGLGERLGLGQGSRSGSGSGSVPGFGPGPGSGGGHGLGPVPGPALGPVPGRLAGALRGPGRRRLLVPVAAAAAVLLVAVTVWAGTHRTRRIEPKDGGVSVAVPYAWSARAGVEFPGTGDADDGVRAGSGDRAVAVAFDSSSTDPAAVLALVRPAGCALTEARSVRVGPWTGRTERFTGCDGGDVDEVVLTDSGSDDWTVWIEVRSVDGDPDLADVLASLQITSS